MEEFLGLGAMALLACAVAMMVGGTVKGVVGIGLPLVSLPVMATFIPIPKAIALLVLSSFATSVWQTFRGRLFVPLLRRLWPLLVGITIGTPIGVGVLATFNVNALYSILGTIVAVFAVLLHRSLVLTVSVRAEPWAAPAVGAVSGVVGGMSMLFGPVYAMYLAGLKFGKERFVAAIALSNVWASLVLATSLERFNLLGGTDLVASLLALIPSFAGLAAGQWLRGRIDEDRFRKVLAVVLFLIGLNLIRKAFG